MEEWADELDVWLALESSSEKRVSEASEALRATGA